MRGSERGVLHLADEGGFGAVEGCVPVGEWDIEQRRTCSDEMGLHPTRSSGTTAGHRTAESVAITRHAAVQPKKCGLMTQKGIKYAQEGAEDSLARQSDRLRKPRWAPRPRKGSGTRFSVSLSGGTLRLPEAMAGMLKMERSRLDGTLSRRQALCVGAGVVAGGATLMLTASAAGAQTDGTSPATGEKNRLIWMLSPTGGGSSCRRGHDVPAPEKKKQAAAEAKAAASGKAGEQPVGGCPACNACKHHAKNKVFSSPEAADTHRAHKYCLCTVIEGPFVSPEVFQAVFVDGESADRRDPRVAATLDGKPVDPIPVPMIAGVAVPVILAASGVGYVIWRRNQRRLEAAALLAAPEPLDRG